MKRGVATLLTVLVMLMVVVLIVAAWQSRLLTSMLRNLSMTDAVTVSYRAESQIYDWIAKFIGPYGDEIYEGKVLPGAAPGVTLLESPLPDKVVVTAYKVGDTESLLIRAARPYASKELALKRELQAVETELILALDCTTSMGGPACPSCNVLNPLYYRTRMDEQIKATKAFLTELKAKPASATTKIGLSVFAESAAWVKLPSGVEIRPDRNLGIDQIISVLDSQFKNGGYQGSEVLGSNEHGVWVEPSPACAFTGDYTNIGIGLVFMHDYFNSPWSSPTAKKVELLVTDGEPNQRSVYLQCPVSINCPGTHGHCKAHARDFTRCALQKNNQKWRAETSYLPKRESALARKFSQELASRVLAFGEPTVTPAAPLPTPTRTPTPTPAFGGPTSTPWPTSSPFPTSTPGPSPTPTPSPTPLPPICSQFRVSPTSGDWHYTPSFSLTNNSSETVPVEISLSCFSTSCGGQTSSLETVAMAPGQTVVRGFGAVCSRWSFVFAVPTEGCPPSGFVVEAQNCPVTPTPTPTPTAAPVPPTTGSEHWGIRDPKVLVYVVTVLTSSELIPQVSEAFSLADLHVNAETADKLTSSMLNVLGKILQKITIQQVIPPAP